MSVLIKYVVDCLHCGGEASRRCLDLTAVPDGTLVVDVELSVAQAESSARTAGA